MAKKKKSILEQMEESRNDYFKNFNVDDLVMTSGNLPTTSNNDDSGFFKGGSSNFFEGFANTMWDLASDIGQGFTRTAEGIADAAQYGLSDIGNFWSGVGKSVFGENNLYSDITKSFADTLKQNAKFESSAALWGTNEDASKTLFGNEWRENINKKSYLGDMADSIGEGIGNIAAMAGMGGVLSPVAGALGMTTGTGALTTGGKLFTSGINSYASAYGNARSEAYKNGASDDEANKSGIINGLAEAISEQFFDSMPGISSAGLAEKVGIKDFLANKIQSGMGSHVAKTFLKLAGGLEEGAEEMISNALVAVGQDIMHSLDDNYTYGMENLTGNILEDFKNSFVSEDSLKSFISAGFTSAILGVGGDVLTTTQQNQVINAFAKDNDMSFKEAKELLGGQTLAHSKEQTQREANAGRIEVNNNVELEDIAKQRIINYMKANKGQNIESHIEDLVQEEAKRKGVTYTPQQITNEANKLRKQFIDQTNNPERYKVFEQKAKNEKDNELIKQFKEAKFNDSQEAHETYNFIRKLQDANPKAKYRVVNNEILQKEGKAAVDENGKVKAINGAYVNGEIIINRDAKNPLEMVAYHEISHAIKETSPKLYNDLKNMVYQLKGKEGLNEYRTLYGVKEGELASNLTDNVEDEYINDKMGEILNDEKYIDKLTENRSLLQRLIDEFKRVVKYMTSGKQQKQLIQTQAKLEKAYKLGYEKAKFKGSKDTAFSLDENLKPNQANEINYSLSQDSTGKELTKEQQEYFKDSKVRDNEGRLLEVYHGTPNAGFTIFDTNKSGQNTSSGEYGLYFTDSKEFADEFSYERLETDSMFFDKKGKKGEVYPVYLNATNILDFANLTEQEINNLYNYASNLGQLDGKEKFVENMLKWQQIGNHQLMKGNLDLKAIADNSNYDGIKAKLNVQGNENEYIVFNSNQIKNTDNTNPTSNPDIRFSLSVAEANAQTNNYGQPLTKGQKEYFKDSKAVNEDGELVEVFHTMTDRGTQFNEFNPIGTLGYRFGDQVVTYYTDNQAMSTSYAGGDQVRKAYSKPLKTIDDVKEYIDFINRETNDTLKVNGITNNYEIKEEDGKYVLTQSPQGKEFLGYANLSKEGQVALDRVKNNENLHQVFLSSDNPAQEVIKQLRAWYDTRQYDGYPELAEILEMYDRETTKLIAGQNKYSGQSIIRTAFKTDLEEYLFGTRHIGDEQFLDTYRKSLYKTYENEQDLIDNIQKNFESKYQYGGYVNITNPYVINTYGENWNSVLTERDAAKSEEYYNLVDTNEKKAALTQLAEESRAKHFDYTDGVNGLDYTRYKNIWEKVTNRDLRDVIENTSMFGGDYNSWIEAGKRNAELFGEQYVQDVPDGNELLSNYVKNLNTTEESTIKDMTIEDFVSKYSNAYENEMNYGNVESYFKKHYKEITGKPLENIDTKKFYDMAYRNFDYEVVDNVINKRLTTNDIVNRIIESNKTGETNYDGIIMKDVYDYGSNIDGFKTTGNLYVTFNSNQFKLAGNENPTQDSDIRYQLTEQQEPANNLLKVIESYDDYLKTLPSYQQYLDQQQSTRSGFTDESHGILTNEDYKNKKIELFNKQIEKADNKMEEQAIRFARENLELNRKARNELQTIIDNYKGQSREEIFNSNAKEEIKEFVKKNSRQEFVEEIISEDIRDAQKAIRNTQFIIDKDAKGEFADGLTAFKKNNPGLKIKYGKSNIDSAYQELAETYPGMFETDVNDKDIPFILAEFLKKPYRQFNNENVQVFELNDKEINSITNKIYKGLTNNAISDNDLEAMVKQISDKVEDKYARAMAAEKYREIARDTIDITDIKDKKRGIQYKVNTMKRNLRDIMSKEQAQLWYNTYFKPISVHNAQSEIDKQDYVERIQKYNLNNEESTYTQMLGELKYNPESKLTSDIVNKYAETHKIDTQKCTRAVEEFRNIYDELIVRVNEALKANGYKEIDYRKGYFPHFIEDKPSSILGKMADKLGWHIQKGTLPTDIAGITEGFKPGKSWVSFSQKRTGDTTDYNALKGMDNYLRGAMDLIYHTEDIQKLRALENEIRYQFSDSGVQEKIDNIYADNDLSPEEKAQRIAEITDNAKDNPLGNLVTELRDYTNGLANKKSILDRGMEQSLGRDMYSIMNNVNGRVSANMVGANLSSAMTNFIPITQAWSQVSTKNLMRGMYESIKNSFKNDGFDQNSVYLTNRTQQADTLYKTTLDKVNQKLGILFEGIDAFTSNTIVRAKYYENLEKGMSEQRAMENADEFAKDVMAGRSKGDQPTIFNTKNPLYKMFTAFQLEVNNQYGYMFKDVPADIGSEAKDKLAMAFMKMFLGAWLYNMLSEKITGRKAAFSPIDMAIDEYNTATSDMDFSTKVQNIAKDIAEETPFVGGMLGGGRLPIQGAIPYENPLSMITSTIEDAGAALDGDESKKKTAINNLKKEWLKPVYYLALPFAGGQIKKTNEGLAMYNENLPIKGSYTSAGKLRFEADTSPLGIAQAAIFGQYASENAREYFNKGYTPLSEKQINEALDANLPVKEYREINTGLSKVKKTAKENGESQTEAEYDYIYNLPISMEQKNSLLNSKLGTSDNVTDDNGYIKYTDGSNTYWYDEENDIVYNSKYREMSNMKVDDLTKYSNKKDLSNYGEYESLEEFNYANNNPTKYSAIKQITDYSSYNQYKDDIAAIKDNYNDGTKAGQNKAKQAVFDYINSLSLNQYQKLMLNKMAGGYSIKTYKNQMFNYINGLDLSAKEKQDIYNELFS